MTVSESQPELALVDDGDALPQRIDYLRREAGRGRVNVHGEGFYADHDIELHPGRTAVDMNTTLQEIALDVMPQEDDGIPVAEHPLERSAS
jgi:hypothetical protein